MSCYFRHIKGIMDEAGIKVTPDNRNQIDRAIHQIVDVTCGNCPETWKRLKQQLAGEEHRRREFIRLLMSSL